MNLDKILEKLADFFINFGVAAFAVAAFQNRVDTAVPGLSSLVIAIALSALINKKG